MKRLTIVTICRNDREGLDHTFASVFSQTSTAFEYIVVDGASTDGSVELIRSNADRVDRWVSEPDGGIYDAQNKGWRMATASYVLFLNAGDVFPEPDVVQRALSMFDDQVDIAYGDAQLRDEQGAYAVKHHPERITSAWMMKEVVAHSSQFIRKALLERCEGYDTRYHIVADYAFFARAFWLESAVTRKIDVVVSGFDTSGLSSDPRQKERVRQERREVQRLYAPRFWYWAYHTYAAFNRMIGR